MADWNTELPFVDVFRMSRPWISQKQGARFGEEISLDRRQPLGYPGGDVVDRNLLLRAVES